MPGLKPEIEIKAEAREYIKLLNGMNKTSRSIYGTENKSEA